MASLPHPSVTQTQSRLAQVLDWGGGGGGEGGGVDDDTEAVAKSAVTLYANFIHFLFNELISV